MSTLLKYIRRQGDQKDNQQTHEYASRLIREKRYGQAAQAYLAAKMHREAVSVLERYGSIIEAAKILISIGAPKRAAILLERNKRFKEASMTYADIKLFMEAARAAKRGGLHLDAANYFAKCQRWLAAASSYVLAKEYFLAGRNFGKAQEYDRAAQSYLIWLKSDKPDLSNFHDDDRNYIAEWIKQRNFSTLLINTLQESEHYANLIHYFTLEKDGEMLLLLVKAAEPEILSYVLQIINFRHPTSLSLARTFEQTKNYLYAGIIYEKTGQIEKAADNFDKAGKHQRALSLYCKIGKWDKAKHIKSRDTSLTTSQNQSQSHHVNNIHMDEDMDEEAEKLLGKVDPASKRSLHMQEEQNSIMQELPQAQSHSKTQHIAPPPPPKPKSGLSKSLKPSKPPKHYHPCTRENPPRSFYFAPMMMDLVRSECDTLWKFGHFRTLAIKETLITDKASINGCFIVLAGKLVSPEKQLTFKESETIGETALLSSHSIHMHIYAQSQSQVYYISRPQFKKLAIDHGLLVLKIYNTHLSRLISEILQSTTSKQQPMKKSA